MPADDAPPGTGVSRTQQEKRMTGQQRSARCAARWGCARVLANLLAGLVLLTPVQAASPPLPECAPQPTRTPDCPPGAPRTSAPASANNIRPVPGAPGVPSAPFPAIGSVSRAAPG